MKTLAWISSSKGAKGISRLLYIGTKQITWEHWINVPLCISSNQAFRQRSACSHILGLESVIKLHLFFIVTGKVWEIISIKDSCLTVYFLNVLLNTTKKYLICLYNTCNKSYSTET